MKIDCKRVSLIGSPEPRWGHTSTALPNGSGFIVFGGNSNRAFNDIQYYNIYNNSWSKIEAIGVAPSERYGHSAALYQSQSRPYSDSYQIIFFGGRATSKPFSDINILYVNSNRSFIWKQITTKSIEGRAGHTVVVYRQNIVVFGGHNNHKSKYYNSLLLFSLESNEWKQQVCGGIIPAARATHSTFQINNKMFIFGGYDGKKYYNDIYCLDLETWIWKKIETKGIPPKPRSGHSATLIQNNKLMIFGGCGSDSNFLNDIHILHIDGPNEYRWEQPQYMSLEIPQARFRHCTNFIGGRIYIYAGTGSGNLMGDLHTLEFYDDNSNPLFPITSSIPINPSNCIVGSNSGSTSGGSISGGSCGSSNSGSVSIPLSTSSSSTSYLSTSPLSTSSLISSNFNNNHNSSNNHHQPPPLPPPQIHQQQIPQQIPPQLSRSNSNISLNSSSSSILSSTPSIQSTTTTTTTTTSHTSNSRSQNLINRIPPFNPNNGNSGSTTGSTTSSSNSSSSISGGGRQFKTNSAEELILEELRSLNIYDQAAGNKDFQSNLKRVEDHFNHKIKHEQKYRSTLEEKLGKANHQISLLTDQIQSIIQKDELTSLKKEYSELKKKHSLLYSDDIDDLPTEACLKLEEIHVKSLEKLRVKKLPQSKQQQQQQISPSSSILNFNQTTTTNIISPPQQPIQEQLTILQLQLTQLSAQQQNQIDKQLLQKELLLDKSSGDNSRELYFETKILELSNQLKEKQATIVERDLQIKDLGSQLNKFRLIGLDALDHRQLLELEASFHNGLKQISAIKDQRYLNHLVSLEKEKDQLKDQNSCVVCATNPPNIVLLPCRHSSICSECCTKLSKCPICRSNIDSTIERYN